MQGDRLLITANGTVGQAESAFNTTIANYQMPNGSLANAELLSRDEICAAGVEFALLGLAIWAIWRGRKGLWL